MLAKMYGLAGHGIFEQAQADAMHGVMKDFIRVAIDYIKHRASRFQTIKFFQTEAVSSDALRTMYHETFEPAVKKYFGMMEDYASQGRPNGYFLHSGISYVDFGMSAFYEFLYNLHPELMSKFPNIRAIVHRVYTHPRLQNYIASRPKTVW